MLIQRLGYLSFVAFPGNARVTFLVLPSCASLYSPPNPALIRGLDLSVLKAIPALILLLWTDTYILDSKAQVGRTVGDS